MRFFYFLVLFVIGFCFKGLSQTTNTSGTLKEIQFDFANNKVLWNGQEGVMPCKEGFNLKITNTPTFTTSTQFVITIYQSLDTDPVTINTTPINGNIWDNPYATYTLTASDSKSINDVTIGGSLKPIKFLRNYFIQVTMIGGVAPPPAAVITVLNTPEKIITKREKITTTATTTTTVIDIDTIKTVITNTVIPTNTTAPTNTVSNTTVHTKTITVTDTTKNVGGTITYIEPRITHTSEATPTSTQTITPTNTVIATPTTTATFPLLTQTITTMQTSTISAAATPVVTTSLTPTLVYGTANKKELVYFELYAAVGMTSFINNYNKTKYLDGNLSFATGVKFKFRPTTNNTNYRQEKGKAKGAYSLYGNISRLSVVVASVLTPLSYKSTTVSPLAVGIKPLLGLDWELGSIFGLTAGAVVGKQDTQSALNSTAHIVVGAWVGISVSFEVFQLFKSSMPGLNLPTVSTTP